MVGSARSGACLERTTSSETWEGWVAVMSRVIEGGSIRRAQEATGRRRFQPTASNPAPTTRAVAPIHRVGELSEPVVGRPPPPPPPPVAAVVVVWATTVIEVVAVKPLVAPVAVMVYVPGAVGAVS